MSLKFILDKWAFDHRENRLLRKPSISQNWKVIQMSKQLVKFKNMKGWTYWSILTFLFSVLNINIILVQKHESLFTIHVPNKLYFSQLINVICKEAIANSLYTSNNN